MPLINRVGGSGEDEIKLQSNKSSVTPTKDQQTIYPDSGYNGMTKLTVNPIPASYIIPSGTMDITQNGVQDVTSYSSVNVYIPEKFITFMGSYLESNTWMDGDTGMVGITFTIPSSVLGNYKNKTVQAYSITRTNATAGSANGFLGMMWSSTLGTFGQGIDNRHEQMSGSSVLKENHYYDNNNLIIKITLGETCSMTSANGSFTFILCFE